MVGVLGIINFVFGVVFFVVMYVLEPKQKSNVIHSQELVTPLKPQNSN